MRNNWVQQNVYLTQRRKIDTNFQMTMYNFSSDDFITAIKKAAASLRRVGLQTVYEVIDHI